MERRLAAILAADVVGYSRLMGANEVATLKALREIRDELIDGAIEEAGGRIVKLMGDGILAEFVSVVSALEFALTVQQSMARRNVGIPEDRQILFRMGVNLGDLLIEDGDIFGDGVSRMKELQDHWHRSGIEKPLQVRMGIHTGYCTVGNFGSEDRLDYTIIGGAVNVASRLQAMAAPGQILLSYETFAIVEDRIECSKHGEVDVRGIAYPIVAYSVLDRPDETSQRPRELHEHHAHFNMDIDMSAMSEEDRATAVACLRKAMSLLDQSSQATASQQAKSRDHSGQPRSWSKR